MRTGVKVREPLELRFGMMRGVGRGVGVLDGGPRRARGSGSRFGNMASGVYETEAFARRLNFIE